MDDTPESGASAPLEATSLPDSAAAPGALPLAYTDPGRHKRGTNPCMPRRWKREARRAAKARKRADEWLAVFGHEMTNASNLTPEQRGNAWPAPPTSR